MSYIYHWVTVTQGLYLPLSYSDTCHIFTTELQWYKAYIYHWVKWHTQDNGQFFTVIQKQQPARCLLAATANRFGGSYPSVPLYLAAVLVKVATKICLFQYIERPQQSHNALRANITQQANEGRESLQTMETGLCSSRTLCFLCNESQTRDNSVTLALSIDIPQLCSGFREKGTNFCHDTLALDEKIVLNTLFVFPSFPSSIRSKKGTQETNKGMKTKKRDRKEKKKEKVILPTCI